MFTITAFQNQEDIVLFRFLIQLMIYSHCSVSYHHHSYPVSFRLTGCSLGKVDQVLGGCNRAGLTLRAAQKLRVNIVIL